MSLTTGVYGAAGHSSVDVKDDDGSRAGTVRDDAGSLGGYLNLVHTSSGLWTDIVAQGTRHSMKASSDNNDFRARGWGWLGSLETGLPPQGVFLLTGPSGTGKTETALTLADTLFGGEKSLITINLSEYQEPHTVSQLKGSPPGYVGYGQGGVLTEAVRKRPYSVVLLDEVEKAHRDVMNLFYQVFDRGFMRDGEGRVIDFRNTVILMTANLGSDHIMQLLEEKPDATDADLHELLYPLLRDHFQPALMARFQTVIYRPLGQEAMRTIVEMKLAQVVRRLHQHYGLETEINDSLYDQLTAACLLPDTGARNIDSLLNQQILPVLSQQLLAQQAVHHKPARLRLGWDEEDGIVLEFDEK